MALLFVSSSGGVLKRTGYASFVIALIDYGAGNLRSVEKALRYLEADVRLAARPEDLRQASAVVLPGVGAFDDCVQGLQRQELLSAIRDFIAGGRPFLGICVGYQALFEKSDEFNSCAAGLGIFEGKVVRFSDRSGLKVPQIGWNQIEIARPDCPILRGIPDGTFFYFVHSFFPQPWTSPSSPHALLTGKPLLRPSGVTTCLPRNSIPKKPKGRPAIAEELCSVGSLKWTWCRRVFSFMRPLSAQFPLNTDDLR